MSETQATDLALKEWSGVVEALMAGRPTLLVRKGGIAERGFEIQSGPFWLFPTWSHQQEQGLRQEAKPFVCPPPGSERACLPGWARVKAVWTVKDPASLPLLEKWHLLKPETVQKRFEYRYPGLSILAVEAFRLAQAKEIPANPAWEGCHSWLRLDKPLELTAGKSCLNSAECDGMVRGVEGILGGPEAFSQG